jgi:small-conductance mechanosensitive channel
MIVEYLAALPTWIQHLVWSLIALLSITLVARVATRLICLRLKAWALTTQWHWDDAVVDVLQKGMPWWSFLFGLYMALSFWQFSEPLARTLNQALYTAGWLSVTFMAADLASRLVGFYGRQFSSTWPITSLTQNLAQLAIISFGLLMVLHGLGVPIAPLLTAMGVGGLAVALALQDTLANLFAGFYLTLARQVRVGDYIRLDSGEEGHVQDISWRSTEILLPPNNLVYVPNKKLSEAIVTNFDRPTRDIAMPLELGVDYRSDLPRVERVTVEVGREVMKTVKGGVADFCPLVRFHGFGDSSIQCTVILRSQTVGDQALIKHEFIKQLHARYQAEGITPPFPTRTVHLLQPSAETHGR